MANFSDVLFGGNDRFERVPRFKPSTASILDRIAQMGISGLEAGPADFSPIEAKARRDFSTRTIPELANQFSSMGPGSLQGSGFQGALHGATTDLETNLAAMRSQQGMQQQQNLLRMLQLGLAPQEDVAFMPGKLGLLGGLAPGVGKGLGNLLATRYGQPSEEESPLGGLLGMAGTGAGIGGLIGGPLGAGLGAGGGLLLKLLSSLLSRKGSAESAPSDGGSVTADPNTPAVRGL